MKRVVLCLGALAMVLVMMGASRVGAEVSQDDTSSSDITITHTAAAGQSQCLPPALAGTAVLIDSATSYTVRITAWAPICDTVSAVVYAMPDNIFYPWPQHRLEVKTVDITPGVTTITFAKHCSPTQFDVVTGQTPLDIQPSTGPMHGPLLYMIPWTGYQNWPGPCTDTTTTTLPGGSTTTSTTSTTVAPGGTTTTTTGGVSPVTQSVTTTTVPGAVEAATQVPGSSPTTTSPTGVADATTTRATTPAATVAGLAFTGASVQWLIVAAVVLLAAGALSMVLARRRR